MLLLLLLLGLLCWTNTQMHGRVRDFRSIDLDTSLSFEDARPVSRRVAIAGPVWLVFRSMRLVVLLRPPQP